MSHTADPIEPASDQLITRVGQMTTVELDDYLAKRGDMPGLPHSVFMAKVGSFDDHDFI